MSAVGLMLLEDPKARARAEAKVRNGGGKRRSFLGGRSRGPAPRAKPNLPPTIPDEDGEDDPVIIRPSTSIGSVAPLPSRKKDSSDRSSSRNSIFGRKNSVGESSIKSGTSSQKSKYSVAVSSQSREKTSSEADQHQQSRKHVISPPFQFNHVTHTSATHLPPLETVDEKDLPGQFWSASGYARPKQQQNGIKSDDAYPRQPETESEDDSAGSRPVSPISPDPPRIPPAPRVSVFDATIFNEVTEKRFDPDEGAQRLQSSKRSSRNSKRSSAILAGVQQMDQETPKFQSSTMFHDHAPSIAQNESDAPKQSKRSSKVGLDSAEATSEVPTEGREGFTPSQQRALTYRSKEALPPLPEQKPTEKSSESSLGSTSERSSSASSLQLPREQNLDPASIEQDRSSGSTAKSQGVSFAGDVRTSTIFSDSTWEDDIDYVYEQEAEATCDFDWDFKAPRSQVNSIQSEGGVRFSGSSAHARAPSGTSEGGRSSRVINNGVTIAERRQAQQAAERARGSSVGHRGFAASRNSTSDSSLKNPAPLNISSSIAEEEPASPMISIAPSDGGSPRSLVMPDKLQFPLPPKGGRLSVDNLSDPESWRNSSKHRKSSSYGSYESYARGSATAPVNSAKETTRWSLASSSSAPGLVQSRPKRTSSLSKNTISPPLATLPQQPEDETAFEEEEEDRTVVPYPPQQNSEQNSFMRKSRTSGDRKVLQAAGGAVQSYRPTTAGDSSGRSRGQQYSRPASGRTAAANAPQWI